MPDPKLSALRLQHHPQVPLVGTGAERPVRRHPGVAEQGQREAADDNLDRPCDFGAAEEVNIF